jgi:hypothetical protein
MKWFPAVVAGARFLSGLPDLVRRSLIKQARQVQQSKGSSRQVARVVRVDLRVRTQRADTKHFLKQHAQDGDGGDEEDNVKRGSYM